MKAICDTHSPGTISVTLYNFSWSNGTFNVAASLVSYHLNLVDRRRMLRLRCVTFPGSDMLMVILYNPHPAGYIILTMTTTPHNSDAGAAGGDVLPAGDVVTRFAPSPTGHLHVGGARTALFNWLLARQTGGRFILRIEDTDQARSSLESTLGILQDMQWLGLDWDEGPDPSDPASSMGPHGPYYQSQRLGLYNEHIDRLMAAGVAYYAFDTSEELDAMRKEAQAAKRNFRYPRPETFPTADQAEQARADGRPVVVRFAMPGTDITVDDQILGTVTFKASELDDFIIRKSDGYPTYHLACVVDDQLMGVTHVCRAQEHLMNTPRHIALQDALSFRRPAYAHMPVIMNADGSKMSKRDKEKAIAKGLTPPEIDVHDFRRSGYMPECLLNFLALLGWNPGDDREIMSRDELVALFSLGRVGKTNAKFDRDKLRAFNTDYIKAADFERLLTVVDQFLAVTDYELGGVDDDLRRQIVTMYQPRSRTLVEMATGCRIFLQDEVTYDPKAVSKVLGKEGASDHLRAVRGLLDALDDWSADPIEHTIGQYCEQAGVGMKHVAQPIRVAVSGSTVSPGIGQTLALLGKSRTLARIDAAAEKASS